MPAVHQPPQKASSNHSSSKIGAEGVDQHDRHRFRRDHNDPAVGRWELDVEDWEGVWTEEACRIFGFPDEEAPDLDTLLETLPLETRARIQHALERSVETQEPFVMEVPLRMDEEYRWIEIHGLPTSREAPASKIVGTVRDITERTRRRKEVRQSRREAIDRLARVAEHRDFETSPHTRRVGKMSRHLAEALGRPPEWQELVREAAPLHDVGKIGIPDAILLKPGPLSDEEFETMKEHTLIGASLLSGGQTKLVQMAERIARSHHERWDGAGYPVGLEGEEIPPAARIVAVADAFDVMTHERPYREKALPVERAFETIEEEAGAQFDPSACEAALRIRETLAGLT